MGTAGGCQGHSHATMLARLTSHRTHYRLTGYAHGFRPVPLQTLTSDARSRVHQCCCHDEMPAVGQTAAGNVVVTLTRQSSECDVPLQWA